MEGSTTGVNLYELLGLKATAQEKYANVKKTNVLKLF